MLTSAGINKTTTTGGIYPQAGEQLWAA